MEQRQLGTNGPQVSALALGCMGMSDMYGSAATRNDADSLKTLQRALAEGVSLFNTADFYGMGHNESLLRQALAGQRERALISVKCGVLRTPGGGFGGLDLRPAAIKNFAAYSLQRLGVDVIDIYQPARLDPTVPLEDTIGAIADLIREGKVRYLGVSEMNAAQLRRAHAVHPVTALEIEYSLATRLIERDILPTARELGIGVVAYGTLSRGLLTGKLDGQFGPADFRAHTPRFQGENFQRNQALVAALQPIAARLGATPAQLALAWVMAQGSDIVTLMGTSREQRLLENLGAAQIRLGKNELAELDRLFGEGAIVGERYHPQQMSLVAS